MTAPTYDLNAATLQQRSYFEEVTELVEEVLEKGEALRPLTSEFGRFVAQTDDASPTCHEESLVELLMLGVLWRARGPEVIAQQPAQRNLVVELVRERRAQQPKRRDGSQNSLLDFDDPLDLGKCNPSMSDLARLSDWLLATGEYDDESKRIDRWIGFLAQRAQRAQRAGDPLRLVVAFAFDFELRAKMRLGKYTANVNRFLLEQLPSYKNREDAAQCSRRRIEYHLNMVGAEILNRAWQSEFLDTDEQIVVVPGCQRGRSDSECGARRTETELACTHCSQSCLVSQTTRLAERFGKSTVAVVHGSDFSRFLRAAQARGKRTGIVGVACVPGILGAGFRAKEAGLKAQCVLLEASGCAHWRTTGTATGFSFAELERILTGQARRTTTRRDWRQAGGESLVDRNSTKALTLRGMG